MRSGLMMSVALYTHKPKKFRFVQAINGLQMWRAGASNKVFSAHISVESKNIQRKYSFVQMTCLF